MSTCTVTFNDSKEALEFLENLALNNSYYIFRGHSNSSYKLETTFARFYQTPHELLSDTVNDILRKFQIGLIKIGKYPLDKLNNQDWLEYARHQGVAIPCIDFTYSPYIALFFAFNEVRVDPVKPKLDEYVVVYALDMSEFANGWISTRINPNKDSARFTEALWDFLDPKESLFNDSFPETICFIPHPGKYNVTMQRQMGALLYDNQDYHLLGYNDLEDFIDKICEPGEILPNGETKPGKTTLTKVQINKNCNREIFERLELMGISGTMLFFEPVGVAMDIKNSYYYVSKTGFVRDIISKND